MKNSGAIFSILLVLGLFFTPSERESIEDQKTANKGSLQQESAGEPVFESYGQLRSKGETVEQWGIQGPQYRQGQGESGP